MAYLLPPPNLQWAWTWRVVYGNPIVRGLENSTSSRLALNLEINPQKAGTDIETIYKTCPSWGGKRQFRYTITLGTSKLAQILPVPCPLQTCNRNEVEVEVEKLLCGNPMIVSGYDWSVLNFELHGNVGNWCGRGYEVGEKWALGVEIRDRHFAMGGSWQWIRIHFRWTWVDECVRCAGGGRH